MFVVIFYSETACPIPSWWLTGPLSDLQDEIDLWMSRHPAGFVKLMLREEFDRTGYGREHKGVKSDVIR